MESTPVMGYVLSVDGAATDFAASFEAAEQAAKEYIPSKRTLRIESAVAPAPTRVWNYDYSIGAWVERL